MVCNLLIVITSIYRVLRTPPQLVEVGKSPIIPNLSTQENSGSELPSGTGGSERAMAREGNVSQTRGGGGSGNNDTGSYPRTATSSSSTGIELTEIYESDLEF